MLKNQKEKKYWPGEWLRGNSDSKNKKIANTSYYKKIKTKLKKTLVNKKKITNRRLGVTVIVKKKQFKKKN